MEIDVEPSTEPTPLSILEAVGTPPLRVHDNTVELPAMIGFGEAVNVLITGAGAFTVTVTLFVADPVIFDAVKMNVVVIAGLTDFDVAPSTDPTLLSILRVVGFPPLRVQESVVD